MWKSSRQRCRAGPRPNWTSGRVTPKACSSRLSLPSKRRPRAERPRHRRPRHHPYVPWPPEENASMPCRPRPEAEEAPQRCDPAQCVRTIERWLQHAEEELLYTPDAPGEAAATSRDARYYLRWGGGGLGVLAIMRFPMDARHPLTQQ